MVLWTGPLTWILTFRMGICIVIGQIRTSSHQLRIETCQFEGILAIVLVKYVTMSWTWRSTLFAGAQSTINIDVYSKRDAALYNELWTIRIRDAWAFSCWLRHHWQALLRAIGTSHVPPLQQVLIDSFDNAFASQDTPTPTPPTWLHHVHPMASLYPEPYRFAARNTHDHQDIVGEPPITTGSEPFSLSTRDAMPNVWTFLFYSAPW